MVVSFRVREISQSTQIIPDTHINNNNKKSLHSSVLCQEKMLVFYSDHLNLNFN